MRTMTEAQYNNYTRFIKTDVMDIILSDLVEPGVDHKMSMRKKCRRIYRELYELSDKLRTDYNVNEYVDDLLDVCDDLCEEFRSVFENA